MRASPLKFARAFRGVGARHHSRNPATPHTEPTRPGHSLSVGHEGFQRSRFATGRKSYNTFEINGSKGRVCFNLERMNELELYIEEGKDSGFRTILATDPKHPYVEAWWPPGHILGYEHSFTHTVADLLSAVKTQQLPTPNFDDGVIIQRVLDAIERSAGSRRWEQV
jgi:predicted dehydrogenase